MNGWSSQKQHSHNKIIKKMPRRSMEILIKRDEETAKNVLALLTSFIGHLFLCGGNLECFIVN